MKIIIFVIALLASNLLFASQTLIYKGKKGIVISSSIYKIDFITHLRYQKERGTFWYET
jgi:hypothetical protein